MKLNLKKQIWKQFLPISSILLKFLTHYIYQPQVSLGGWKRYENAMKTSMITQDNDTCNWKGNKEGCQTD